MAIQKKMSPEETREYIHSLRGKFKMVPDGKSFTEWMADLNREEIELEDARIAADGRHHRGRNTAVSSAR
jgi:hypothetical protein